MSKPLWYAINIDSEYNKVTKLILIPMGITVSTELFTTLQWAPTQDGHGAEILQITEELSKGYLSKRSFLILHKLKQKKIPLPEYLVEFDGLRKSKLQYIIDAKYFITATMILELPKKMKELEQTKEQARKWYLLVKILQDLWFDISINRMYRMQVSTPDWSTDYLDFRINPHDQSEVMSNSSIPKSFDTSGKEKFDHYAYYDMIGYLPRLDHEHDVKLREVLQKYIESRVEWSNKTLERLQNEWFTVDYTVVDKR